METNRPFVGVGVFIIKDNKILIGQRKGNYGEGMWGLPGGHLEYKEDVFDCAERETLEESGVKICNLKMGPAVNHHNLPYDKHYVTLFVFSEHKEGEPEIIEPDKLFEWRWVSWDEIPQPIFHPLQDYINAGFSPFE